MLKKIEQRIPKRLAIVAVAFSAVAIGLFALFAPTIALGVSTVTIRGNINKVVPGPSLVGVANQPVTVVCGSANKNTTTNVSGLYTVNFTEPGCNPFSIAKATSNFNASIITRQVGVSSEGRATIDLNF